MSRRKWKILVVDDMRGILDLVEDIFEHDEEIEIKTSQMPAESLRMLKDEDFDCLVLDMKMPCMSGHELYNATVEKRPEMKERVIFMTGDTCGKENVVYLENGGFPLIQKPFSILQFKSVLYETLSKIEKMECI